MINNFNMACIAAIFVFAVSQTFKLGLIFFSKFGLLTATRD